jgi:hypothetical protein
MDLAEEETLLGRPLNILERTSEFIDTFSSRTEIIEVLGATMSETEIAMLLGLEPPLDVREDCRGGSILLTPVRLMCRSGMFFFV